MVFSNRRLPLPLTQQPQPIPQPIPKRKRSKRGKRQQQQQEREQQEQQEQQQPQQRPRQQEQQRQQHAQEKHHQYQRHQQHQFSQQQHTQRIQFHQMTQPGQQSHHSSDKDEHDQYQYFAEDGAYRPRFNSITSASSSSSSSAFASTSTSAVSSSSSSSASSSTMTSSSSSPSPVTTLPLSALQLHDNMTYYCYLDTVNEIDSVTDFTETSSVATSLGDFINSGCHGFGYGLSRPLVSISSIANSSPLPEQHSDGDDDADQSITENNPRQDDRGLTKFRRSLTRNSSGHNNGSNSGACVEIRTMGKIYNAAAVDFPDTQSSLSFYVDRDHHRVEEEIEAGHGHRLCLSNPVSDSLEGLEGFLSNPPSANPSYPFSVLTSNTPNTPVIVGTEFIDHAQLTKPRRRYGSKALALDGIPQSQSQPNQCTPEISNTTSIGVSLSSPIQAQGCLSSDSGLGSEFHGGFCGITTEENSTSRGGMTTSGANSRPHLHHARSTTLSGVFDLPHGAGHENRETTAFSPPFSLSYSAPVENNQPKLSTKADRCQSGDANMGLIRANEYKEQRDLTGSIRHYNYSKDHLSHSKLPSMPKLPFLGAIPVRSTSANTTFDNNPSCHEDVTSTPAVASTHTASILSISTPASVPVSITDLSLTSVAASTNPPKHGHNRSHSIGHSIGSLTSFSSRLTSTSNVGLNTSTEPDFLCTSTGLTIADVPGSTSEILDSTTHIPNLSSSFDPKTITIKDTSLILSQTNLSVTTRQQHVATPLRISGLIPFSQSHNSTSSRPHSRTLTQTPSQVMSQFHSNSNSNSQYVQSQFDVHSSQSSRSQSRTQSYLGTPSQSPFLGLSSQQMLSLSHSHSRTQSQSQSQSQFQLHSATIPTLNNTASNSRVNGIGNMVNIGCIGKGSGSIGAGSSTCISDTSLIGPDLCSLTGTPCLPSLNPSPLLILHNHGLSAGGQGQDQSTLISTLEREASVGSLYSHSRSHSRQSQTQSTLSLSLSMSLSMSISEELENKNESNATVASSNISGVLGMSSVSGRIRRTHHRSKSQSQRCNLDESRPQELKSDKDAKEKKTAKFAVASAFSVRSSGGMKPLQERISTSPELNTSRTYSPLLESSCASTVIHSTSLLQQSTIVEDDGSDESPSKQLLDLHRAQRSPSCETNSPLIESKTKIVVSEISASTSASISASPTRMMGGTSISEDSSSEKSALSTLSLIPRLSHKISSNPSSSSSASSINSTFFASSGSGSSSGAGSGSGSGSGSGLGLSQSHRSVAANNTTSTMAPTMPTISTMSAATSTVSASAFVLSGSASGSTSTSVPSSTSSALPSFPSASLSSAGSGYASGSLTGRSSSFRLNNPAVASAAFAVQSQRISSSTGGEFRSEDDESLSNDFLSLGKMTGINTSSERDRSTPLRLYGSLSITSPVINPGAKIGSGSFDKSIPPSPTSNTTTTKFFSPPSVSAISLSLASLPFHSTRSGGLMGSHSSTSFFSSSTTTTSNFSIPSTVPGPSGPCTPSVPSPLFSSTSKISSAMPLQSSLPLSNHSSHPRTTAAATATAAAAAAAITIAGMVDTSTESSIANGTDICTELETSSTFPSEPDGSGSNSTSSTKFPSGLVIGRGLGYSITTSVSNVDNTPNVFSAPKKNRISNFHDEDVSGTPLLQLSDSCESPLSILGLPKSTDVVPKQKSRDKAEK